MADLLSPIIAHHATFRPSPNGQNHQIRSEEPASSTSSAMPVRPVEPRTIAETGLSADFLDSLILKLLYKNGVLEGGQIATEARLHFSGIVEPVLMGLKQDILVEVKGGNPLNSATYRYALTEKGVRYAREAQERNRYVGPCPVSLTQYFDLVKAQTSQRPLISQTEVRRAFQELTLAPETIEQIGPAVISFKSLFLYGPPGNGKTSVARAIGQYLLGGEVLVPYAICAEGQVIKVHDPETHHSLVKPEHEHRGAPKLDRRWVRCYPPVVTAGGELMLNDLNLAYNDTARYYEAPLQLKANGGLLLIDDFGRQQVKPQDLLNRWIVPLEERIDYLTFHNGQKVAVPFEALIIFSTNLKPEKLADGAFLRRIRYKLEIDYPTLAQYYQIFIRLCQERGLTFERQAFTHLIEHYYQHQTPRRPFQACHPRDLLDQLADFARFRGEPVRLTVDLLDKAANSYFTRFT